MKVQNVGLCFSQKPKKDETTNDSDIFLCALSGSVVGAASGALARNYAPVSDEFFYNASTQSTAKKTEVEEAVNSFIDNYSVVEIEDARVLKTVLQHSDIQSKQPQIEDKGISALLSEESIKPISKEDSQELNNAVKALHTQISQEIKEADEKKTLPEKFESLSAMASDNLTKTKRGIFVRENLQKYKKQLHGLSDEGKENISAIKESIANSTEGSAEMRQELGSAFTSMVKVAQKTQRPVEFWVLVPSIISGILGMGAAVNHQLQKDLVKNKTKKEPQK